MFLFKCLVALCAISTATSHHVEREWLENLLIKTSQNQQPEKLLKFRTASAAPNGTNYGSEDTRVTMDVLLESGEIVERSLIVVDLPSTPLRQKNINESGLFKTDILVHRLVLPKMKELMKEVDDRSEPIWIDAIGLKDYEQLILEDAEADGYRRRDKTLGLDLNECEIAVISIAKFHALSAVLHHRHQLPIDHFTPLLVRNKDKIGKFFGAAYVDLSESMKNAWGSDWFDEERLIANKSKTIDDDMLSLLQRKNDTFSVLNHGGFFINNVLFKNGISDVYTSVSPIGMKIHDFQVAHFNSPAFDLQFFLNTSPQITLMIDKKDRLVNIYFEALIKYLKQFRYKGSLPTRAHIMNEIKRTELYGVTEAINHLSLLFLKPELIPDFEKLMKDSGSVPSPGRLNPQYIRAMKILLRRAIDNNVYQELL